MDSATKPCGPDLKEEFWDERPLFEKIRDFARSRRVSPWALLGVVLARAGASVGPWVKLPATIGSPASLNLAVGLVGESGGGKTAAVAAARDFLEIRQGVKFLETSPGSGEGLLASYGYPGKPGQPFQRTSWSTLLVADEVQALGQLTSRTNSTLLPTLKSAWSGSVLGNLNADPTRRRHLDAHSYRLAIIAGVQPAYATVILEDAAGGFPQRWTWLPTYDDKRPAHGEEVQAESATWTVPDTYQPTFEEDGTIVLDLKPADKIMVLPEVAKQEIWKADDARNVPLGAKAGNALDGHALLNRAKIAGLLALLDGRLIQITEDDWRLAGIVMQISDETRETVTRLNYAEAERVADRKAVRTGKSAAIAHESEHNERVVLAMARMRKLLADGEEHSRSSIRKRFAAKDRNTLFEEAVERMEQTGELLTIETEYRGQPVTKYQLVVSANE